MPGTPVQELVLRTILVIDDEECIRSVIADILEGPGCRVVAAADGASGLASARHYVPDLILLDHLMPEVSGAEVLGWLRADAATAAIPVIMMSGMPGAAFTAAAYLAKPFTPAELGKAIDGALARGRAAAA
jgi:CheY-like chemotaxis protein